VAGDIFEQLGGTIPTMASAKLKHLSTIRQLSLIMSGQPDALTLVPTAPRVETATPPRMMVAVPSRMATTSNTITALNTIRRLPIVHQQDTCNNNPFQILSDDDDDRDDNETVVASNCSPKTPLPMLHERHGPIAIPPTIPQLTTHCPKLIQKPSPPLNPHQTMLPNTIERPTMRHLLTVQKPNPPLIPLPPVMPLHWPITCLPKAPLTASPQTLVIVPSVNPSIIPHDLHPRHKKRPCNPAPTAMPHYNIIEPDNDHQDCITSRPATQHTGISIQTMHHVMTLEIFKVATSSQWTGPIINIKEHCFGFVYPVTKQTITQYKKIQHNPDLKHLWVPALSKEVYCLAQGKEDITKNTSTIFFLSHKEIWCIPTNRTVTYDCIVIDHCPQKEDPNRICITVGGNLINYLFKLTTCTTDMVSLKLHWNSTISTKGAHFAGADIP
jgi:hypothetical protein